MWTTGMATCRICGHQWTAVIEADDAGNPPSDLECPNCHNMTGELEDEPS